MFENKRYITCGVENEIPVEIQLAMWGMIDNLRLACAKLDYLQVFRLSQDGGLQKISHTQEKPKRKKDLVLAFSGKPVEADLFVIDDGDHSTMLLTEEY